MSEPATELTPPVPNAYVNRELSWLEFNARVLEEAEDTSNPLLERLRFLTIFHMNLDEFFMVRVSGIRSQVMSRVRVRPVDGMSPREQLEAIQLRVDPMMERAQECLLCDVLPALEALDVAVVPYKNLKKTERAWADEIFQTRLWPILTPLAVGSTQPFPFISNLSLNLALWVESPEGESKLARVKVPLAKLPRLFTVDGGAMQPPTRLVLAEDLIAGNLDALYPGMKLGKPWRFRVTRDADLDVREDQAEDLMSTLEEELRKRRMGEAVRLEVQKGMPEELRDRLLEGLNLDHTALVEVEGPLAVSRLDELLGIDLPDTKYPAFMPRPMAPPHVGADLYRAIKKRDILLHHPFEAFDPVVDFIRHAASDPDVLAIKQTLYRTNGDSPIIQALEQAVENGKQVAAVIELKARFDEENNITWARRLEQAGCHVIYGVQGLKTHSKLALVVRKEGKELVRYAHIGTGNYNPITARIYTDLGLFTARPEITADVGDVFNRLTGFARPAGYRHLLVAPHHMRQPLLDLVEAETRAARRGKPAHIIFKCNALTHPDVIDALYDASRAGVRVDLLVRGICRLIPGVPGMSETIRVRSVIGRFLEHHRVYWFQHGGKPKVYLGSADLMERNLDRRVEVLVPILSGTLRQRIRKVLLQRYLDDEARTREMQPDASYVRLRSSDDDVDVHEQFMVDG